MGWGVQVTTDIYVSKVRKEDVKSKIEENDELIRMFETELFMIASANPREITSEESREEGDIIEELRIKIDKILEGYRSCIRENQLLSIISDEIENAENC